VTEVAAAAVCPACAEPIGDGDEFCEACGHQLRPAEPTVTTADQAVCPNCGAAATERDRDGYCLSCGHMRPRGTEHTEIDAGAVAAVTDKGHRHRRNEDAMVIRSGASYTVIVVCDGVSQSANPDQASAAASVAVADHMAAGLLQEPAAALDAIATMFGAAVAAGQQAVLAVPPVETGGYPDAPSATLVAAVVRPDGCVVANVGDSRAYWIDADRTDQVSTDDSLAQDAITAGVSSQDAYAAPGAHTVTRWLGADAREQAPHIATLTPANPGRLLVCSDGLWNYFEALESLHALVTGGPAGETAIDACRRLVQAALDAGGADNVTVAMALVTPPPSTNTDSKE
jgi:serine/threonine protein phosphatase PrpC